MKKYLIKEVAPEATNFEWFFDGDIFNENAGDFCYTLFIVSRNWGRWEGYNVDTWKETVRQAENLLDAFQDVPGWYTSHKAAMEDAGIPYTPHKCHALKEWAKDADTSDAEAIADFLTITTGHKWEVLDARGYCQGDYAQVVYCPPFNNKEGAKIAGDLYFGCGKEFYVSDLDENGEEIDTCYGYFVADCQVWEDEEYKKLVCEWAGIPEDEAELQIIADCYTSTHYTYRTA